MTGISAADNHAAGADSLSAVRQAQGLSIAEVAAQLRISPRQVEALESGRYDELPGAVFVRGFVRNYARVLKIDPVPLLHALEPSLTGDTPLRAHATAGSLPASARGDHSRVLLMVLGIVLAALIGAGGYELWTRREWVLDRPTKIESATSAQVKAVAKAPIAPSPGSVAPVPMAEVAQSEAVQPQSEPERTKSTDPTPAPPHFGRIVVHFARESWVEIRDRDSKVILSASGQPGSERTVEGLPPFTMVVGNAGGVRVTYNDQPIDVSAHATRNIARFTLE